MGSVLRKLVSLLGLGVLVALALGYRSLPGLSPVDGGLAEVAPTVPEFHRFDRAQVPGMDDVGEPCGLCHPAAAHFRDSEKRSFLNLHRRSLDCGACHLRGKGVAVRHFRDGQVVSEKDLADGPYGQVYAATRKDKEWQRVTAPGGGVTLRATGPRCGDCHRRGSTVLATDGLVDPYRRRVLEDLSVLRFLGRKR